MINALMTSRNNPRVKSVIGIVRRMRIGFTTALSRARTAATITAVSISGTSIPGRSLAQISTASPVTKMFARNFIEDYLRSGRCNLLTNFLATLLGVSRTEKTPIEFMKPGIATDLPFIIAL